jgi:hypothetical protein
MVLHPYQNQKLLLNQQNNIYQNPYRIFHKLSSFISYTEEEVGYNLIEYYLDLELVTVQPLTRGTGNHIGPTVSSGSGNGRSGPIVIENIVVLDGQVIDRRIKKVALGDYSYQV